MLLFWGAERVSGPSPPWYRVAHSALPRGCGRPREPPPRHRCRPPGPSANVGYSRCQGKVDFVVVVVVVPSGCASPPPPPPLLLPPTTPPRSPGRPPPPPPPGAWRSASWSGCAPPPLRRRAWSGCHRCVCPRRRCRCAPWSGCASRRGPRAPSGGAGGGGGGDDPWHSSGSSSGWVDTWPLHSRRGGGRAQAVASSRGLVSASSGLFSSGSRGQTFRPFTTPSASFPLRRRPSPGPARDVSAPLTSRRRLGPTDPRPDPRHGPPPPGPSRRGGKGPDGMRGGRAGGVSGETGGACRGTTTSTSPIWNPNSTTHNYYLDRRTGMRTSSAMTNGRELPLRSSPNSETKSLFQLQPYRV